MVFCVLSHSIGHTLGQEVEAEFTRKAEEAGLSETETKNGFNQNMLSTGLLADGPLEYSKQFGRRWLATNYEAGDVVLHTPFTVRPLSFKADTHSSSCIQIHASTINSDPNNAIRLGTDLRFVNGSKPWDTVRGIRPKS